MRKYGGNLAGECGTAGQQRVRVRVQGLQPLTHWIMASRLRRLVEWRGQASVADISAGPSLHPVIILMPPFFALVRCLLSIERHKREKVLRT